MKQTIQSLFETIREECSREAWSRGVELMRANAVAQTGSESDEFTLEVNTRGGLVCLRVILYPADEDWECDCSSHEPVCDHVAAAIIALRRSENTGEPLERAQTSAGRIAYRFSRVRGQLHFQRVVDTEAGEVPLEATLQAITSGRVDGPQVSATATDRLAEGVIDDPRRGLLRGTLPRGLLHRLLEVLAGCDQVTLDGQPIHTSAEPVGMQVRVEDADDGFRVRLGQDPSIVESFGEDVVLCGDTLRPQKRTTGLTGRELDELRDGLFFERGDVGRMTGEVLPALENRIPIEIATRKLPRSVEEPPRVAIEVRREGPGLSVLPTLVYGDPAIARIDSGRLKILGDAIPRRDLQAESRLERDLRDRLQLVMGHRVSLFARDAIDFAQRLERFDCTVRGDAHRDFFEAAPLSASLQVVGDDFQIHFASGPTTRLDSEANDPMSHPPGPTNPPQNAEPSEVLRAWQSGSDLVPLIGGGLAPLPVDWLERYGNVVADLLEAKSQRESLPRAALPDLARLAAELGEPEPPGFGAIRQALGEGDTLPQAVLPEDLTAELRPYQADGVDWLCVLRDAGLGAVLADEMGLGKTLQALCAVRGRSLVVAPTSVLANWIQEVRRFRPALKVAVHHGPNRRFDPDADLTLTTYAILRLDIEDLASEHWSTLVLDEAQNIKNPDSQMARAAFRLRADFRMTLTGTPVENRLEELWSQFHFSNPGLLGQRRDFEERYAGPIEGGDTVVAEHLRRRIHPFLLRRLKRDVAPELPARTEMVRRPALSESERAVYDAIVATTRRDVVEKLGRGAPVMAVLEALLRLRQAACHAGLLPGREETSSAKVDLLLEVLDESVATGHKTLVFSQWTSLLDLVEPQLQASQIEFARLDGSTRDRGAVVETFQSETGPPVLLASLKAGGVGLNLTAADSVIILDPWWNPAVEDQAADRAHRIGQDKPVTVLRLVTQNTVEERILELQKRKRALAQAAIGDAGETARITRGELLELLE
ncbi:SNF2 family helicase [Myxococcota bacterium]|nr:SNF2 family helicase [Myxococcota bacterium]